MTNAPRRPVTSGVESGPCPPHTWIVENAGDTPPTRVNGHLGEDGVRMSRRSAVLRHGQLLAVFVLLLQYLAGMAVNLFVKLPDQHPGTGASEYFGGVAAGVSWAVLSGGILLTLHAVLGLLLVLMSAGLLVLSVRAGERGQIRACSVAALAIVGAGFNGGSFLNYGNDFSSMIMAGLWALAVGSYAAGLIVPARADRARGELL